MERWDAPSSVVSWGIRCDWISDKFTAPSRRKVSQPSSPCGVGVGVGETVRARNGTPSSPITHTHTHIHTHTLTESAACLHQEYPQKLDVFHGDDANLQVASKSQVILLWWVIAVGWDVWLLYRVDPVLSPDARTPPLPHARARTRTHTRTHPSPPLPSPPHLVQRQTTNGQDGAGGRGHEDGAPGQVIDQYSGGRAHPTVEGLAPGDGHHSRHAKHVRHPSGDPSRLTCQLSLHVGMHASSSSPLLTHPPTPLPLSLIP